jgi:Fur family ferric uptake transcriptional regulator
LKFNFNYIQALDFKQKEVLMVEAHNIFIRFLKQRGYKLTKQRDDILSVFLKAEGHLSVDDMYEKVKKRYPRIGHTTVFRTLKLLCKAGIAREIDLGDRIVRYERKYGHEHHDHLICVVCSKLIEAADPRIEKMQDELCRRFEFIPLRHKLEIFGICNRCIKNKKKEVV